MYLTVVETVGNVCCLHNSLVVRVSRFSTQRLKTSDLHQGRMMNISRFLLHLCPIGNPATQWGQWLSTLWHLGRLGCEGEVWSHVPMPGHRKMTNANISYPWLPLEVRNCSHSFLIRHANNSWCRLCYLFVAKCFCCEALSRQKCTGIFSCNCFCRLWTTIICFVIVMSQNVQLHQAMIIRKHYSKNLRLVVSMGVCFKEKNLYHVASLLKLERKRILVTFGNIIWMSRNQPQHLSPSMISCLWIGKWFFQSGWKSSSIMKWLSIFFMNWSTQPSFTVQIASIVCIESKCSVA